jgi:putative membrane protein
MITSMSQAERTEIANAIKAQEAKTSGEIYCVVARRSDDYSEIIMIYGVLAALLLPIGLGLFFPQLFENFAIHGQDWGQQNEQATVLQHVWPVLGLQTLIFIACGLVANNPNWSIHFVPKFVKRQSVHKAALEQFTAHGIHQTDARTGVLIYLSQSEKMVEVVADKGIYSKVDKSVWEEAVVKILAKSKDEDKLCKNSLSSFSKASNINSKI